VGAFGWNSLGSKWRFCQAERGLLRVGGVAYTLVFALGTGVVTAAGLNFVVSLL